MFKEQWLNLPNLMNKIKLCLQEAYWTPQGINTKRSTSKHIIAKMLKAKNKRKIVKVTREKWLAKDFRLPRVKPIFRIKLKKVGKTTRPFRYDLNQIPYDYTVEVRNRFKGLDLIECLMNCGFRFMTLYRRQGSRPSPRKRNAKRQNGCLRRP